MRILIIIIIVFPSFNVASAQTICNFFKATDKKYYTEHEKIATFIDTTGLPIKKGHALNFNFGGKILALKDNLKDDQYHEYYYAGRDKKKKWLLIKKQDYNQDYYYLFNTSIKSIDTLVGYPSIYGNKILCLEGSYTDGFNYIEVWEIKGNKLIRRLKLSLSRACGIYPSQVALSDKMEIMIKDNNDKYWKSKPQ